MHGTDTEAVGARLLELAARLRTEIPFVATTSAPSPDGLLMLTRRGGVPTLTVDPRFLTLPRPVQDGALASMVAVLHLRHLDRAVRRRRTAMLLVVPMGPALIWLIEVLPAPFLALVWLAAVVGITAASVAIEVVSGRPQVLEADRWVADTGGLGLLLPFLEYLQANPPKPKGLLGLLTRALPSPEQRASHLRG
jgi:hypothetical protein